MIIGEKMDILLRPEMVENVIHKKMNPKFSMIGLFKKQNLDGDNQFDFATKRKNTEEDIISGILGEPVEVGEGSEFPQIAISGIQEESGNITKLGFEVEFSEELIKSDKNLVYVQNTLADMGYTMRRLVNRFAFAELMASAEAPTITLTNGSWANPTDPDVEGIDTDIKLLQRAFNDQEGYDYDITNMFVSKQSYWGAEDYYEATKLNGFNPSNVRGSILESSQEIASGLLGIDLSINPAIWYYNVDEEDNTYNDPNDPNSSIINVNRFENDNKHPKSLGFQMYVELGMAVTEPLSVVFQEGI